MEARDTVMKPEEMIIYIPPISRTYEAGKKLYRMVRNDRAEIKRRTSF